MLMSLSPGLGEHLTARHVACHLPGQAYDCKCSARVSRVEQHTCYDSEVVGD